MRLHRVNGGPGRPADPLERAQLFGQATHAELVAVDVHGPATEALGVGIGGVRTDAHAAVERGADGRRHGVLVARVAAARDVGRRHEAEQRAFRSDPRRIGRLTDVGVEVDAPDGDTAHPASRRSTTTPSR